MKKQKQQIDYGMYAENINGVLCYNAPDYQFTIADEKDHNYATLVIGSNHLRIT